MADFKSQSLWIKLASLFMDISMLMYLYCYNISGWATVGRAYKFCPANGGTCDSDWVIPVEVCQVIAYLCSLAAFVLTLSFVFLDEVKGDKRALIAFVVLSILAGLLIIVGVALFRRYLTYYTYSDCITIVSALVMAGSGIFGIVELVAGSSSKVSPKK